MQLDEANATIGRRIAELRTAEGTSQAQLAQKLAERLGKDSIDPTTITRLERGTRPITVVEILALARIFYVDPASLLPQSGTIEEHLWNWGFHQGELQADKEELEAKLVAVTNDLDGTDMILGALNILHRYQRTGDETKVGNALEDIASYCESCTESTLPIFRVDIVQLLEDLSIDQELIRQAVEWGETGDDGVLPSRVVRYVINHHPFEVVLEDPDREEEKS